MQSGFFFTVFYQPLYNALVFLVSVIPGGSVGIAIITLTLAVRIVTLPLSHRAIIAQKKLRDVAPHIEKVKEQHKDDKQEQAKKIMELYRAHGINPLSGLILVVIQLPIIFALYYVLSRGLPSFNTNILYSFVHLPDGALNMSILGISLAAKHNIILALIAGITQFFQIKLSIPPTPKLATGTIPSFKDEFARSFSTQTRFILPIVIFGVAYTFAAAVALYWITSNLFSITHELYVKRRASGIAEGK